MFSKQCKLVIKCLSKDINSSRESHESNSESVLHCTLKVRNILVPHLYYQNHLYIFLLLILICMLHQFQVSFILFKHVFAGCP